MITYCNAISRLEAMEKLRAHASRGVSPVPTHGYIAWIGIEPDDSPLKTHPQERQLVLFFDDYLADEDLAAGAKPTRWFSQSIVSPVPPIRADAEKIVEFVRALAEDPRPWALVVHCTAAVSRSTAVVKWVRERYGVQEPPISPMYERARWKPNTTLARLLREVGG